MGLDSIVILLVVIVVAVTFFGTQINDFVQSLTNIQNNIAAQKAVQQTNAALTLPAPKAGDVICSLKVVFNPKVEAPYGSLGQVQARISSGAQSINWYSCHVTTMSLLMLVPMMNPTMVNAFQELTYSQKLDFLNGNISPGGYRFSGTLVADDGTQKQPLVTPVPAIGLNPQSPAYGQSFTLTYIFQDIPRKHYQLQISSTDIGINQIEVGNIYFQNIPP